MTTRRWQIVIRCSVAQSCRRFAAPWTDCSRPGFCVLHGLLELVQAHAPRVCGTVQPSHPLPHPSLFAFRLSQRQGLFQRVGSSRKVAKVLELQLRQQLSVRRFKEGAGGCWKGVSEVSPRGHELCLPVVTGSGSWWCFPARVPPDRLPPLSTALFKDAYRMDGSPVFFVSVWFPPHSLPCMGSHRNTGTVTRVSLDAALPVICVKGTLRYLQRDAWWLWTN